MSHVADRVRELWYRLKTLGRRERLRLELDEEMAFHRELLARDIERDRTAGGPAAGRAFGNTLALRERSDSQWGWPWIEDLIGDLRYGLRHLRRSPMFAAIAIGAIGIAIGINAGFFTLVDVMVFQPMAVAHPDRFVRVMVTLARGGANIRLSHPDYQAIGARSRTFEDVVASAPVPMAVRTSADSRPLSSPVHVVSGNFFSALGGRSEIGRALLPSDDRDGAAPVIVLSHRFWVSRFGADSNVAGREVSIGGTPVRVAGVIPADFIGTVPLIPDFWMTIAAASRLGFTPGRLDDSTNAFLDVRGHLRPGVPIGRAQAELSSILGRPRTSDPHTELNRISGALLKENRSLIPAEGQTALLIAPALAVVALVLIIACANLANLLLARALARQREMALRLSIGASRGRLVRQLLTESLVIAIAGAALGLLLSHWTVTIVSRAFLGNFPTSIGSVALQFRESWRVVAYTVGLCVTSVLFFGLAPALQATSADLSAALKGDDAVFGTRIRRSAFRDWLLAAQVAACAVLLVASVTLVRLFADLAAGDTGLDVDNVLVASMGLTPTFHVAAPSARQAVELSRQVAALPGVAVTARALRIPFTAWFPYVRVQAARDAMYHGMLFNRVTPGYFSVVGQRLLQGRGFTDADSVAGARVAVVSAAAARFLWPGQPAVGQSMLVVGGDASSDQRYSIVGVVSDAHSGMILDDDSDGYLYMPATADDFLSQPMPLLVRAEGRSAAVARAIGDLGARLSPDEPLQIEPALAQYDLQLTPIRYGAIITAVVGLFGLSLAILGLYGIVSFSVTQRRRDVAVHIAMGAGDGAVLKLVLRREIRLVLIGLGAGAVLALGETLLMKYVLVGVPPISPVAFVGVGLALFTVALIASLVPARKALTISPMQVLRQE